MHISDIAEINASNSRGLLVPLLTHCAPSIKVGIYNGKTKSESKRPPLLIPTVIAAPNVPMKDRVGVPIARVVKSQK